ncbi:hypothetical protein [Paenibacillus hexagrammi]|uniref:Uncharacterized protein n=1 Tax=Paenibacillus hexagrammi TaxID=2908839 RepID=A0ABY3SRW9_9BACL|nr:hypothetical protein [Paenibacillus sp. YPD9-1]UJF35746.1 hypothetical protein L0M14_12020 [Paenibacillus sp. YPD9-1]
MTLLLNHVYGIVYRQFNGRIVVYNGRVVSRHRSFIVLRFMNHRGIVVLRKLFLIRILRVAAI